MTHYQAKPAFDTSQSNQDDELPLKCPRCKDNYLHLKQIHTNGCEDAQLAFQCELCGDFDSGKAIMLSFRQHKGYTMVTWVQSAIEAIIPLGPDARIRCPAAPADCTYVAVDVNHAEIGRWNIEDWKREPALVMGEIMGAITVAVIDKKKIVI